MRGYHSFVCGVCKVKTEVEGEDTPQCAVCMTPLCEACNKDGFCAGHFEQLVPEDKALVARYFAKAKSIKNASTSLLCFGLASTFIGLMIFLAINGLTPHRGGNPWAILPFAMFWIFLILALVIKSGAESPLEQIRAIGKKYQSKENMHKLD